MTPAVPGMVVAIRVTNVAVSSGFYRALGFIEEPGELDADPDSAVLRHGECGLLLAPGLMAAGGSGPALLSVLVDDVDAVLGALRDGGFEVSGPVVQRAPRSQVALLDPDGNTVLIGQQARSLRDGLAAIFSRTAAGCEVRDVDRRSCEQDATVKLADSAGHAVWACLDHADEILVTVSGAFIASQADRGLAAFLARRREPEEG
jgi:catechol 2,3-dioxygenase-like lactoylglutathione lyase family enzyme